MQRATERWLVESGYLACTEAVGEPNHEIKYAYVVLDLKK
jgi:hypothetical protein